MSCFVCSDKCFEVILTAVWHHFDRCARRIKRLDVADKEDESAVIEKLQWFGNELRKMNVKSYNARYDENNPNSKVDFKICHLEYGKELLACAVKQILCLQYQSCEFDGYENDWRWKALDTIAGILSEEFVKNSKEYENCHMWG